MYSLAYRQLYENDDLLLHEFEETYAGVNELIEQLPGRSQNNSGVMLLLDELIESVRLYKRRKKQAYFKTF